MPPEEPGYPTRPGPDAERDRSGQEGGRNPELGCPDTQERKGERDGAGPADVPELAVDGQRTDDGGERQYPADQEPGVPGGGGGRQYGLDEGKTRAAGAFPPKARRVRRRTRRRLERPVVRRPRVDAHCFRGTLAAS